MTKADILDGLAELKVCNSYKVNGEEKNYVPFQMNKVDIEPVYKSFTGWQKDITAITGFSALPDEMKHYISYLDEFLGVPVKYISNGTGRDQLVTV